jgi:hypothetical protein
MATKKKADNGSDIPPPPPSKCRRFWLYRKADQSGVSGTGYVAEGVEWTDGRVDVRFLSAHKTDNGFPNMKELMNLHGHEGDTEVVWIDPPFGKTEDT